MRSRNVLAFAHSKGGSGSTSTVINVAAELAAAGRDVLVVDCDPTAASTFCLLPETPATGLEDVLAGRAPLASAIVPTAQARLRIVPTSSALSIWDHRPERLPIAMERVLDEAAREADLVILDLPPAASTVVQAVISTLPGGKVVAPVQARVLDLVGLGELVRLVEAWRATNRALHIAGVCPTRVRPAALCRDVIEALAAAGHRVLPEVRESLFVARAPLTHRPLRLAYPKAAVNADFRKLARAIGALVPKKGTQ